MAQNMKNTNVYQKTVSTFFVALVIFWTYLFLTHHTSSTLNYWYSFLFGLIPLIGGLIGMVKASIWGGLKSALGKAVFFVSLGLFLWGLGESVWSYYNFFKDVPAPYPSLADIGFAPSIFFWILGTAYLSRATGALLVLKRSRRAKLLIIVLPIVLLIPAYYLQIHVAREGVLVPEGETTLKAVLDVAYPFGDFLALSFAALVAILSYRYFGGIYRRAVYYLLAGLAIMYCADSIFSYTTTKGTYYNANWGDLLLTLGLYLITVGILAFASKPSISSKAE
jgi:hypothetical protein